MFRVSTTYSVLLASTNPAETGQKAGQQYVSTKGKFVLRKMLVISTTVFQKVEPQVKDKVEDKTDCHTEFFLKEDSVLCYLYETQ